VAFSALARTRAPLDFLRAVEDDLTALERAYSIKPKRVRAETPCTKDELYKAFDAVWSCSYDVPGEVYINRLSGLVFRYCDHSGGTRRRTDSGGDHMRGFGVFADPYHLHGMGRKENRIVT